MLNLRNNLLRKFRGGTIQYSLNCFVIFELKVGEFIPEFAGKLNFYINAINKQIKQSHHKPTIGVLLCRTPKKTIIEYVLTDLKNPIGVADYEVVKTLPSELRSKIPTVEELETEIDKEYEELQVSSDERLEALKKGLAGLKAEPVYTNASYATLCNLFDKCFYQLYESLINKLSAFNELFIKHGYSWPDLPQVKNLEQLKTTWKNEQYLKNKHTHHFQYVLEGFKLSGPKPINIVTSISLNTEKHSYTIAIANEPCIFKYYHQPLQPSEIETICSIAFDNILSQLESTLKQMKTTPQNN